MIQLTGLFQKDTILTNLKADSKKEALDTLIASLKIESKRKAAVRKAIFEREEIISTGVGNGIGLPHCKVEKLDSHYAAFATLGKPIGFESVDNKPVHILFLLASPASESGEHLKLLGRISRMLNSRNFREKLVTLETSEAVLDAVHRQETKHSI